MLQISATPEPQHLSPRRRAFIWLAVLGVCLTHGAGPAWAGAMTRNAAFLQGVKIASSLTTTDGFVLTYVGANSDLELKAAAGGGSGALTLISTQTASSSASLSWTGLTGQEYRVACANLLPSISNDIILQVGEGGTPTWKTTGYLSFGIGQNHVGATVGSNQDTNGIDMNLAGNVATAGAGLYDIGLGFVVNLHNLSGTAIHGVEGTTTSSTTSVAVAGSIGGLYHTDTTAITAVRVIPQNSGTIVTGYCSLYSVGT